MREVLSREGSDVYGNTLGTVSENELSDMNGEMMENKLDKKHFPDTYVVVDLETTGLQPAKDRILEIGAWKVVGGKITENFCEYVNPQIEISERIQELTGLSNDMVKDARTIDQVLPEFVAFCDGMDLMGHNILFDYSFLKQQAVKMKIPFEKNGIDTLKIARVLLPELESRSLGSLCEYFLIDLTYAHRAYYDALATWSLYERLKERAVEGQEAYFAPKELLYKPKKQSSITEFQKAYLNDLVKYHRIELHVCVDGLTKSEASRMIDTIISEHGRIKK